MPVLESGGVSVEDEAVELLEASDALGGAPVGKCAEFVAGFVDGAGNGAAVWHDDGEVVVDEVREPGAWASRWRGGGGFEFGEVGGDDSGEVVVDELFEDGFGFVAVGGSEAWSHAASARQGEVRVVDGVLARGGAQGDSEVVAVDGEVHGEGEGCFRCSARSARSSAFLRSMWIL